jgi:hypothetical protein
MHRESSLSTISKDVKTQDERERTKVMHLETRGESVLDGGDHVPGGSHDDYVVDVDADVHRTALDEFGENTPIFDQLCVPLLLQVGNQRLVPQSWGLF